jgi:hypothetical protein
MLLSALVGPGQDPRLKVPVADKARALLLFARKGETGEYKKVLAAIGKKKEEADLTLAKRVKGIKEIEAGLRNDAKFLAKAREKLVAMIRERMKVSERTLQIDNEMLVIDRKMIEGHVKEGQAFTRIYRMLEKERQRGLKGPTLLVQFLDHLPALVGPDSCVDCPHPIPVADKVKALLLLIHKGDSRQHKKLAPRIREAQTEAKVAIAKSRQFANEKETLLRQEQARLAKAKGDTSAIEKHIAAIKQGIDFQKRCLAEQQQHLKDCVKEEQAWKEARRLIEQARKAAKKP